MERFGALLLAVLAISGLTAGYRATATQVTLTVDGEARQVYTHQPTVDLLLRDRGIALRTEDWITPALDTPLESGTEIRVDHAQPVIVRVDGREHLLYAHDEGSSDLLAELGIRLDAHDSLSVQAPLASDPLNTRLRVHVTRAVSIVLEEGATRTALYSQAATVGEAVLQAGVKLYRADRLYPAPETPLQNGMHIRLDRSKPVSVRVDGHILRTRTHRTLVGEVLADLGVVLAGQDYSTPALSASLEAAVSDALQGLAEIRVSRVTESVIVEQSPIPFDSVWNADPNSEIDTQGLLQEGEPGVLERRIRLRYEDGQVVSRQVEGESVVLAPVNRVMGYGTKVIVRTLATESGVIEYWRVFRMLATSYSASTAGVSSASPYYGRTATGMTMRDGIVAVDPNIIPLRSEVYVPGYGIGFAGDTGGSIRGKRIDLGYSDENLKLWYSWVDVYLLTPVPDVINYLGP